MPSHQESQRANPEMSCHHLFIYKGNSDIAPFMNPDGTRTTIKVCVECGISYSYTRTEEQFEKELELIYDFVRT